MIPEYRLINSLLNAPPNKEIKEAIKNGLKAVNFKNKKKLYNFIFSTNENTVFNHIISLNSQLYNYEINSYYNNIVSFNFLVSALMPVFEFQKLAFKKYQLIQQSLLDQALLNSDIAQWYQESQTKKTKKINPDLDFFLKNKKIPEKIKEKMITLTYVAGKLFESLRETDFEVGYYFMLFYLISLETKQTLLFKSETNWHLKSYYLIEDFFVYKLKIVEKFSKILMDNEGQNFNLYLRIINWSINNNPD